MQDSFVVQQRDSDKCREMTTDEDIYAGTQNISHSLRAFRNSKWERWLWRHQASPHPWSRDFWQKVKLRILKTCKRERVHLCNLQPSAFVLDHQKQRLFQNEIFDRIFCVDRSLIVTADSQQNAGGITLDTAQNKPNNNALGSSCKELCPVVAAKVRCRYRRGPVSRVHLCEHVFLMFSVNNTFWLLQAGKEENVAMATSNRQLFKVFPDMAFNGQVVQYEHWCHTETLSTRTGYSRDWWDNTTQSWQCNPPVNVLLYEIPSLQRNEGKNNAIESNLCTCFQIGFPLFPEGFKFPAWSSFASHWFFEREIWSNIEQLFSFVTHCVTPSWMSPSPLTCHPLPLDLIPPLMCHSPLTCHKPDLSPPTDITPSTLFYDGPIAFSKANVWGKKQITNSTSDWRCFRSKVRETVPSMFFFSSQGVMFARQFTEGSHFLWQGSEVERARWRCSSHEIRVLCRWTWKTHHRNPSTRKEICQFSIFSHSSHNDTFRDEIDLPRKTSVKARSVLVAHQPTPD